MPEEFFYSIQNYRPHLQGGRDSHSFGIKLSLDFARRCFETKVTQADQDRFTALVGEQLATGCKMSPHAMRFNFLEDTLLLTSWHVEGDGTWMSIDCAQQDRVRSVSYGDIIGPRNFVQYSSHNVDYREQSYALLTMFLLWANYAPVLMPAGR